MSSEQGWPGPLPRGPLAFPPLRLHSWEFVSISHCLQSTESSGLSQEFHWNVNSLQIPKAEARGFPGLCKVHLLDP
jgi:hypothetical protein